MKFLCAFALSFASTPALAQGESNSGSVASETNADTTAESTNLNAEGVYRMYNDVIGEHLFTTDAFEYNKCGKLANGAVNPSADIKYKYWSQEGQVWDDTFF